MNAQRGGDVTDVNQGAQPRLCVDGRESSLDPTVMRELFRESGLRVEPLGPSQDVRAVSRALHSSHPHWFFIIDRDERDIATVEATWRDFPNPDRPNLLIWRRRELENYFIEASWLAGAEFLRDDWNVERLQRRIAELVQRRLFMDCANLVIAALREAQKQTWIDFFRDPAPLNSADATREALVNRPEWKQRLRDVKETIQAKRVGEKYDSLVKAALGGATVVEHGRGEWLSLVSGKEIFSPIASEAFIVRDGSGQVLQGTGAQRLLARSLLRSARPLPQDFVDLTTLITAAMRR